MAADLPICVACGSQYDAPNGGTPFNCKICDVRHAQSALNTATWPAADERGQDPRQFVPPTGQQWTTLNSMLREHKHLNKSETSPYNPNIWFIWTEPKVCLTSLSGCFQYCNNRPA